MREAYMRCIQMLRVFLAIALTLMLFQAPRAAAAASSPTYTLPNKDFLGCPDATGAYVQCNDPTYRGPTGTFACTDVSHEQHYVEDRDAKIHALHDELVALDDEVKALDVKLLALQTQIDQAMAPGSTTDLPTLRALQNQYAQMSETRKALYQKDISGSSTLYWLITEKEKTLADFHKSCGCTYFCLSDYWQCPGDPPPPTPAPNNPKNGIGGGQCR
jgi:hypothetical protein